MEEARDWERLFIGEIKAGRDPRGLRAVRFRPDTEIGDVSAFLDAYLERCVKPAGLRSISGAKPHLRTQGLPRGLPLSALEGAGRDQPVQDRIEYAEDVEIATMHRALETLRAAMNWGMAQTPPMFNRTPFHRFGDSMDKKAETNRDRRLSRDEEKRLLDAALQRMSMALNTATAEQSFMTGSSGHSSSVAGEGRCC